MTHDRPTESSDLVSTVRRRRSAAAALATVAALTLTGCGTGFNAQTNQVYQPGVGANHRGEIDVLGTVLVANDDGSATLSAGVINKTDTKQTLESVTATTLADRPLEMQSGAAVLPIGVLSTLGSGSDTGTYLISGGAPAGSYVRLTLKFSDAGPVSIEAPVVARTGEYADIAEGSSDATQPAEDADQ